MNILFYCYQQGSQLKIRHFLKLMIVFLGLMGSFQVVASERLVSLKPNITEIVFALGVGSELVGVTTYCDRPAKAKQISQVADYVHVQTEEVFKVRPTLILGSQENSQNKEVSFLKNQGLKVELLDFTRLSSTYESILKIGALLSKQQQAQLLVHDLKSCLTRASQSLAKHNVGKVVITVGIKPLVVVGGQNILDDLLKELGLINPFSGALSKYPHISSEELIKAAPQVLVDLTMGTEASEKAGHQRYFDLFGSIPAVAQKKILYLEMSDFRAAPGLCEGVDKLVYALASQL